MLLPAECPTGLKDDIREQKLVLLKLMRLNFLIVRSGVLGANVFFVSDDVTKQSLVLAGAKPGSIYTRAELGALVASRTTPADLRLIHAVKQQFNGEVGSDEKLSQAIWKHQHYPSLQASPSGQEEAPGYVKK